MRMGETAGYYLEPARNCRSGRLPPREPPHLIETGWGLIWARQHLHHKMALTILPRHTDQRLQLNILLFCDLTGTCDFAQARFAHLFGVFSGDSYGSHIIIL